MSSLIWTILIVGIIGALVGFIILQRRKPDQANQIAASIDAAAKAAEQKAQDAAASLLKK